MPLSWSTKQIQYDLYSNRAYDALGYIYSLIFHLIFLCSLPSESHRKDTMLHVMLAMLAKLIQSLVLITVWHGRDSLNTGQWTQDRRDW